MYSKGVSWFTGMLNFTRNTRQEVRTIQFVYNKYEMHIFCTSWMESLNTVLYLDVLGDQH